MSAPLDWRRIEAALLNQFKNLGWTKDRMGRTGDAVAFKGNQRINLTLLAQDLAKELER